MGNRVLRYTLKNGRMILASPSIFRNIFMASADVVNETLEPDQAGHYISDAARNVVVYYASDDLALRSSKVVNLKTRWCQASRPQRPGGYGQDIEKRLRHRLR